MRIMTFTAFALAVFSILFAFTANADNKSKENLWLDTFDAREAYFASSVGPLPKNIVKIPSTEEVWPGGGLLTIPAPQFGTRVTGTDLAVYTTSGLTNLDMPTDVRMVGFKLGPDGKKAAGRLQKKVPAKQRPGAAGYGYELMVITQKGVDWPLRLLQRAVNEELVQDAGLLEKVEKYGGLTFENIDVGERGEYKPVNILIAKALSPLPTGTQLPAGKMEILVATTITAEEMDWSGGYRRIALLEKLKDAGIGQVSMLGRKSVVR